MNVRCPHCHSPIDVTESDDFFDVHCPSCGSSFNLATDSTTAIADGEQLGHFALINEVGRGGFGCVWKANDLELERVVAVKIPRRDELSANETERFLREARAAAQLQHPHIVSVHEVGCEDGQPYIVSDFVQGVTLKDIIELRAVSAAEAAQICAKLADALEHAHEVGVIHRDLKPSNVLVDIDDEPHLTDFGLAKRDVGETTMTIDGQLVGTPAYMSPEQARGDGHAADARSDIYGLGVILFELLTNELPFRGNPRMLVVQILRDDPPSPRKLNGSVPRDLETITLKCMEKDPAKRYQTAAEVGRELRRFLRGEPIVARPATRLSILDRWCRRNPVVAGLIAAVAATLITATAVSTYFAVHWRISAEQATEAQAESERSKAASQRARAGSEIANSEAVRERRIQGYGSEIRRRLREIQQLGPDVADPRLLRREAIGLMGDFVALDPIDWRDFPTDVNAVAWHPESDWLAVGFQDGTTRLVDPSRPTQHIDLNVSDRPVLTVGFDRGGERCFVVQGGEEDRSGEMTTWSFDNRSGWQIAAEVSLGGPVHSARLEHDSQWLVAWTTSSVLLWDVMQERKVTELQDRALPLVEDPDPGVEYEAVINASVNRDGELLAVGYDYDKDSSNQRGFVVWDLAAGRALTRKAVNRGSQYLHGISFARSGNLFAYGCDEALILYDVPAFEQKFWWRQDSIHAVDFSRDGKFLAAADIRGGVRMWATESGIELAELSHPNPRASVRRTLTFSPDQRFLAVATLDGIRVWHLAGADEKRVLPGHERPVPTITFHPDGETFATGGKDRVVVIWDADTGQERFRIPIPGEVQCVRFGPDGERIAVAHWGGENTEVLVFDAATGERTLLCRHQTRWINRLAFVGRDHLAASGDGGVALWRLPIQNGSSSVEDGIDPVESFEGFKCRDIVSSPDETWLAWTDKSDGRARVKVWKWQDTAADPSVLSGTPMLQGWHGLAISPESDRLFYVTEKGQAIAWDLNADRVAARMGDPGAFQGPHIALSPDGEFLAALHEPNALSIWNTTDASEAYAFRPERAAIWSLEWSPDSRRLLLGLNDGGLLMWDLDRVEKKLADFVPTRPSVGQ